MRLLTLNNEAKQKAADVVAYAKVNVYEPFAKTDTAIKPPGDNPRHIAQLDTFRCVFSFTRTQGELWKHLSISVPSKDYPNPFAVWTIAELFGFTGWDGKSEKPPEGWLAIVNEDEHCIVVAQLT